MSLLDRLKTDQLAARKANDVLAKDLLTTLLGDIQNAMLLTDDQKRDKFKTIDPESIAELIVKSFLKNVTETLNALGGIEGGIAMKYNREAYILQGYMPKQLTAAELQAILVAQFPGVLEAKSKGPMMGYLKTNYTNQYDGKIAGAVVDDVIKASHA